MTPIDRAISAIREREDNAALKAEIEWRLAKKFRRRVWDELGVFIRIRGRGTRHV